MKLKKFKALFLSLAVGAAVFGNISAAGAAENTDEVILVSSDESTVSGSSAEVVFSIITDYDETYTYTGAVNSSYTVNGVSLPLKGYEPGTAWDNCWTFANIVYEAIWGTSRGTNMLGDLSGSDLAITSSNTKKFIQEAELGANIRVEDGRGIYQHSLILVQKDDDGFTVYHGNFNGRIYFTYYTYSEFASQYSSYKYFAYIVFPDEDDLTTETTTEATTEALSELTTEDAASSNTRVSIGSKTVSVGGGEYEMDVAPYIQTESSSTLVPLRFVAIAILGGNVEASDTNDTVSWDAETKTAYITTGNGDIISFTADSKYMTVNGVTEEMSNGVKAEITEGRMFIPFRALGEALGVEVDWDSTTKTAVYITG